MKDFTTVSVFEAQMARQEAVWTQYDQNKREHETFDTIMDVTDAIIENNRTDREILKHFTKIY